MTVFALLAAFAAPAFAQSGDEAAIGRNMDALHKAMVAVDRAQLEGLTWPELSYGHSGGRIENKAQFVEALVTKKSILSKIDLSKMTTSVVGDLAIVRCHFSGISESTGKPVPTEIELLLIWQKRGGDWKLLARQAYKV
jgi:type II secretory pathway pseudopilin PulG